MTRQFSFQTLPYFSPALPATLWSCSILGPPSLGGQAVLHQMQDWGSLFVPCGTAKPSYRREHGP